MSYIARKPLDCNLICPVCGDSYLHHSHVEIFDRVREDAPSTSLRVERGRVTEGSEDNPSPRRDGLAVTFWCEGCGSQNLVLALWQHKGESFWSWL